MGVEVSTGKPTFFNPKIFSGGIGSWGIDATRKERPVRQYAQRGGLRWGGEKKGFWLKEIYIGPKEDREG